MSNLSKYEKPKGAYYNRTMDSDFESVITSQFGWLIEFVKEHDCLDFQTGCVNNHSWFSIYRGTSRILIITISRGKPKFDADGSYKELYQPWFNSNNLNRDNFQQYLGKIEKTEKFGRYYINSKGDKKEGYFQNLISRRYTIGLKPEDPFVIVDKELVIAFENDTFKTNWNSDIIQRQKNLIEKARIELSDPKTKLPTEIKPDYGEFDFLAIDKNGNFIIMELKQNDGPKTYLSPVQTNYYVMQFEKLLKEPGKKEKLCEAISSMYDQKVNMKLIKKGWAFPNKMNCEVRACVVVGNKKGISEETCRRFRKFKDVCLPKMEAYMATSDNDGTLKVCDFLTLSK